jgi:hypothetical protein
MADINFTPVSSATAAEDHRFILIFWFCVGTATAGVFLLAALIFVPIPKENQQMANVALGFITGTLITGVLQYLTGGNPTAKKNTEPTVAQTGDNPVMNVQAKTEQPINKTEP